LLCISEIQAAEAYLDFVSGDFAGARRRLEYAIAADESLEDEFGHSVLHIHRVHLANNTVKVEAAAHNLTGAMTLAANILAYVRGYVDTIAMPSRWGSDWKTSLTEEPQLFLIRQTSAEVACAIAGISDESIRSTWMECLMPAGSETYLRAGAEVSDWYRLKTAFVDTAHYGKSEIQAFCSQAEQYLAAGPRQARLLWHMVCFDVLLLCGDSSSGNLTQLKGELGEALTQATYLPRRVRTHIAQAMTNFDMDLSPHR
jgi:hypothetical protein